MRRPLVPLNPELAAKVRQGIGPRGVDADNDPLGLSVEEKRAAANPGLPAPLQRSNAMDDVKPGWKTTQFWLSALMTLVVLPLLGWLGNEALSPVGEMLKSLGSLNPLLLLAVPIIKGAFFGFIAWCMKKLTAAYGSDRTAMYTAALGSGRPSEAVVNAR